MKPSSQLTVQPVRTRIFRQGENLVNFVAEQVDRSLVCEGMILAITSKIVSLAELRLVEKSSITKQALIEREADVLLMQAGYGCFLTVKHGIFLPSAGIDESNSEHGHFILYPEDPFLSAKNLWQGLRERWSLKNLGVVLTDSHTTPLRRGVIGISLAHWGFRGIKDFIGSPDIFGRSMKMTTVNVADGLASAATLMMGETSECQPLAILYREGIDFVDTVDPREISIPIKEDIYFPIFADYLD